MSKMSVKKESSWLRVCCAGKCRIRIFDHDTKECEVDAGQWCNDHCWNVLVARSPGHQLQTTFPSWILGWLLDTAADTLRYSQICSVYEALQSFLSDYIEPAASTAHFSWLHNIMSRQRSIIQFKYIFAIPAWDALCAKTVQNIQDQEKVLRHEISEMLVWVVREATFIVLIMLEIILISTSGWACLTIRRSKIVILL